MLDRIRIVMVETTHAGNIGAAARAMKTMGLSQLVLVSPQGFPSAEATALASGAADLLEAARVVDSLDEAIADASLVVGTSARQRRIPWPCVTPRMLAQQISEEADTSVAVLFGRESRGLTNEELERCHLHVSIPSNEDYGVLNVAAAIQVISYELRLASLGEDPQVTASREMPHRMQQPDWAWDEPPADSAAMARFFEHLETVLVNTGFMDPTNPDQAMRRLRRLFLRARPDKMEVNMLRGLLTSVERASGAKDK